MCNPDAAAQEATTRVVVVGAGPAGLLSAILLLRRNLDLGFAKYQVTLIDPGVDHGKLTPEELKRNRSWMIGLSCHGMKAIRFVPGLYEDYVEGLGVHMTKVLFGITKTWLQQVKADDIFKGENASFTVDRNHVCAALARYLNDHFEGSKGALTTMYEHKALFVDDQFKRVMIRPTTTSTGGGGSGSSTELMMIPYDLLLGCDGIRSVVRNAFLTRHRDFTFDIRGTFGTGKSVHLPQPTGMQEGTFCILNECIPNAICFCLPETNQQINLGFGFRQDQAIAPELLSDDPAVISAYFKNNFTAFELDWETMGKEWVKQSWNSISQVHCNRYHSLEMSALLLGDAAHATSPQIGQGMNTALEDAMVLCGEILPAHKDDLKTALPAYSAERVKEGNALTDLSFYNYSLNSRQQLWLMTSDAIRGFLHRNLPRGWIEPSPMGEIAVSGMKLSVAYEKMCRMGILPAVRRTNDEIMRRHFELETGMRQSNDEETMALTKVAWTLLAAAGVAVGTALVMKSRRR